MIGSLVSVASDVANTIASYLHFSRPDKGVLREYESWMPDFVQGLSDSLAKASPMLTDQVESLANGISDAMTFDASISGTRYGSVSGMDAMVNAFKDALSEMKIELDDEVAGKFVEKTVARAIYT